MPKMILMVGVPGSGKSYTAKQLVGDGVILSTDDIFMAGSHYFWDSSVLGSAHHINQIKCGKAMAQAIDPVIIDNTNLTPKEREPYEKLANLFGYEIQIKESDAHWKDDADECFNRCTHKVPLETIKSMLNRKKL